jgi:two-component system NarL family sensor kinase
MRSQDEERRRIARELHETFAQDIAAIKLMLGRIYRQSRSLTPETRELISECLTASDATLKQIRTLSYVLHPPVWGPGDFGSTIEWYVTGFSRRSGLPAKLDVSSNLGSIPEIHRTVLFRALQESLTNVHRHSHSKRVDVNLSRNGDRIVLNVRDHGDGLPKRTAREPRFPLGIGITSMQERVKELAGRFSLESEPRKGVSVTIELPLPIATIAEDARANENGRAN